MKRDTKNFTRNELLCYQEFKVFLSRFGYRESDVTGPCRKRRFFEMRQRVAFALHHTGKYSTPEIGLIMKRHHTSILNMINAEIVNRKREIYLQKTKNIITRRNLPGRKI